MLRTLLVTTSLIGGLFFVSQGQSQMPPYPMDSVDRPLDMRPMPGTMRHAKPQPKRMPPMMADFPTPQELSRMMPPEPITEDTIKQRFAKHKARIIKMLERDREEARKYAQDFDKYQKYQADALAKMMARAEKRREKVLQRLDEQEKRLLESFNKPDAAAQEAQQDKTGNQ